MANFDLLEQFLQAICRPIGNFVHHLFHHPVDTAVGVVTSATDWVQDHPYACAAIVGLGALAHHKGWLKVQRNKVEVNVNIDTCLGGYRTSSTLWIGRKNRY